MMERERNSRPRSELPPVAVGPVSPAGPLGAPPPVDPITADEAARMRRVLRWAPRFSFVRRCAEELLDGATPQGLEAPHLCRSLTFGRLSGRERFAAVWALGRLARTEEERAAAGPELLKAMAHRSWAPAGCVAFVVPCLVPFNLFFLAYTLWRDNAATRLKALAITSLGRIGYIPALPQILSALRESGPVRRAALFAAPAVLTSASSMDYPCLSVDVADAMVKLLYRRDDALRLAALDALEKAGPGGAAETVRRLAERRRPGSVRDRAQQVLPILEERLRREMAPQVLLRAAADPDAPQAILLRPAGQAAGPDEAELLLRPHVEGDS